MKRINIHDVTDAELLRRFEEGRDQLAFEEIVRRHGQMVQATIRRILSGGQDNEDAFQCTFFALAKSAKRIRQKGAIAGWLHKAARSCAIDIQRENVRWHEKGERERIKVSETESKYSAIKDPSRCVMDGEVKSLLDEELAALPQKLHSAVVLCDLEGLSRTRAAKELEIGRSTLDSHVVKGRRVLRERLIRRGVSLPAVGLVAFATSSSEHAHALSATEISTTAGNASLFAAGKTAAEIGVSPKLLQTANRVISAMTQAKMLAVFIVALAVLAYSGSLVGLTVLSSSTTSKAGTILFDSFFDKNHKDGSPTTWAPFANAILDASSGELFIGVTGRPNKATNERLKTGH